MIEEAVVLSAGLGRRLNGGSVPKCLTEVAGRSIIRHQLEALAAAGIRRVTIVTGHQADAVESALADWDNSRLVVQTLYNPFYAVSENLASAWMARGALARGALLINGDTLFEPEILRRLILASGGDELAVCTDAKGDFDDDDMKVIVADDIIAAIGKDLPHADSNAEAIGVLLVPAALGATFVDEMESVLRRGRSIQHYYLAVVANLAVRKLVRAVAIDGLRWCEVDVPHDLALAELTMASMPRYAAPDDGRHAAVA